MIIYDDFSFYFDWLARKIGLLRDILVAGQARNEILVAGQARG